MKRILFQLVASSVLTACVSFAQNGGQTGLTFLQLGVGARSLGMGEAYTAIGGDGAAMYYNPATLSSCDHPEILLMHKEWIQDVQTEYLGALVPAGSMNLGISVNSTSINNIELRTVPGPPLETFSARNAAIGFSAAYAFDARFSLGATVKTLYEKILVDESSGIGFDIGAVYSTPWRVRVGAALQNLGSVSALRDEASTLPRILRIGGAYSAGVGDSGGTFTVSSDIVSITNENTTHVHFGGEYVFREAFALRFGYQTGYETKSISAGAGVRYGMLGLDYAFVPFRSDFGTTHTFSLAIDFQ